MENKQIVFREVREVRKQPDMCVAIAGNDISQVHFSVRGPEGTPFSGGIYHGKIVLPANFPYSAPHVQLLTESGRFEVNTNICINGYTAWHQDSWTPAITLAAIIRAVQSLFCETSEHGIGYNFEVKNDTVAKLREESLDFVCSECHMDHRTCFQGK